MMLQTTSIYLLWLSAIFDPIGLLYGFRYIALLAVFFVMTIRAKSIRNIGYFNSVHSRYLFLFLIFLPIYGLIMSIIRGGVHGDSFIDTSYFASAVYFAATISFFQQGNIDIVIRAFTFSTRILSIVIISSALLYFITFNYGYVYMFVENEAAYFGSRSYGGISFYYIYFIASPLLILLLAYESWNLLEKPSVQSAILFLIAVIAMFLSGTRFSMMVAIFTLPVVILFRKPSLRNALIIVTVILLAFMVLNEVFGDVISNMLSSQEGSNSTKLSYLEGYANILDNPISFIFGQGLNAHAWSYEFSEMLSGGASKTELTYLEMIRVFGLLGASAFFIGIIYLFLFRNKVLTEYRWIFPGLAMYLIVSSLNPYIFSSNGMLVFGLAVSIVSLSTRHVKYKIERVQNV